MLLLFYDVGYFPLVRKIMTYPISQLGRWDHWYCHPNTSYSSEISSLLYLILGVHIVATVGLAQLLSVRTTSLCNVTFEKQFQGLNATFAVIEYVSKYLSGHQQNNQLMGMPRILTMGARANLSLPFGDKLTINVFNRKTQASQ